MTDDKKPTPEAMTVAFQLEAPDYDFALALDAFGEHEVACYQAGWAAAMLRHDAEAKWEQRAAAWRLSPERAAVIRAEQDHEKRDDYADHPPQAVEPAGPRPLVVGSKWRNERDAELVVESVQSSGYIAFEDMPGLYEPDYVREVMTWLSDPPATPAPELPRKVEPREGK